MTPGGDHGGATKDETEAALFTYSTRTLSTSFYSQEFPEVPQINILPTLSLLLGVPIPFENIGSIIPQLFLEESKGKGKGEGEGAWKELIDAIFLNSLQVFQYLWTYQNEEGSGGTFTNGELHELTRLLESAMENVKHLRNTNGKDEGMISKEECVEGFQKLVKSATLFPFFRGGVWRGALFQRGSTSLFRPSLS